MSGRLQTKPRRLVPFISVSSVAFMGNPTGLHFERLARRTVLVISQVVLPNQPWMNGWVCRNPRGQLPRYGAGGRRRTQVHFRLFQRFLCDICGVDMLVWSERYHSISMQLSGSRSHGRTSFSELLQVVKTRLLEEISCRLQNTSGFYGGSPSFVSKLIKHPSTTLRFYALTS